jgi:predicted nuclease of predicted toxin-antitoxin system
MKLLFDQNLSFRLCQLLSELFPGSAHVRRIGLDQADDQAIWRFAATNGFILVSLDADFAEMAALRGSPPKVIWLRRGNPTTAEVEQMLRLHFEVIETFEGDDAACLEVY